MGSCTSKPQSSSKPQTSDKPPAKDVTSSNDSASRTRVLAEREYHNVETSTYVLPKDDQEKDRLHEQHYLIKEKFGGNLLKPEFTTQLFEKDINVLDVGCGPATWLMDLATEYPNSNFYGVDIADTFPQAIHPRNLHLQVANVLEPLPFNFKFDFIQIRLLAVAFRESEWEIAFRNIYNVLKPGGTFQVIEICPLLNTTDPEMLSIRTNMAQLLRKKQQNPDMASQLAPVMEQVNFKVLYKKDIEISLGHGTPADIAAGDSFKGVIIGMAPFMAAQMNIDVEEYKRLANKAAANMGPTKATITLWGYLGQRPSDN
ncbi:S-adenosyl-L-methionine-dependent methyltransferase [Umbelopsis sp. AD052]|nr:S-adenosyl-L-methionine-dependent methyltransferase [Umbelopsis sp. AD052]